jgi:hypothetical protein
MFTFIVNNETEKATMFEEGEIFRLTLSPELKLAFGRLNSYTTQRVSNTGDLIEGFMHFGYEGRPKFKITSFDTGKLIGFFYKPSDVAKMLGCSYQKVAAAVRREGVLMKKYKFTKF